MAHRVFRSQIRRAAVLFSAAAALFVSACGTAPRGPADIEYRGTSAQGGERTSSRSCGRSYTVRQGDTLYSIARRCGHSFIDIATENAISDAGSLQPGQVLRMPGPALYTVRRGDTLYRIALTHGMSVAEMASLNGLRRPYIIYPGQDLAVRGTPQRLPQAPSPTPSPTPAPDTAPPIEIEPGAPPRQSDPAPRPEPQPAPQPAAGTPEFGWPIRGEVLSRFGPQSGGQQKDGWTIAADMGAPVMASAPGTVVYVGNELQGYGELVLVRHSGQWVTAYAYNSRILVSRGDEVEAGQIIAEAGNSGGATRTQLYFEIRRGVSPVDPGQFLD